MTLCYREFIAEIIAVRYREFIAEIIAVRYGEFIAEINSTPELAGQDPECISQELIYHGTLAMTYSRYCL